MIEKFVVGNWEPSITTTGNTSDVFWGVKIIEEEDMEYEDYVGIAHQIMAMEYGLA